MVPDHLNGCGENGWRTPDQSPRNHFDFDHEVPYETSQEAWDRRLRRQLQEQNAARGRQVYNDILWAAPLPSRAKQNLDEAMREAAEMPPVLNRRRTPGAPKNSGPDGGCGRSDPSAEPCI